MIYESYMNNGGWMDKICDIDSNVNNMASFLSLVERGWRVWLGKG